MTDSLRAPIESLNYNDTEYTYLTAPSTSPHSINNLHDADLSTTACLPLFTSPSPHQEPYVAILIACFSPHPLVPALLSLSTSPHPHQHPLITPNTYIIDIFAASVSLALTLLSSSSPQYTSPSKLAERAAKTQKFTIISTGPQWRRILSSAIFSRPGEVGRGEALGAEMAGRVFGGVECVGMDASDLHPSHPSSSLSGPGEDEGSKGGEEGEGGEDGEGVGDGETIKAKVQSATKRLLGSGEVGVVVLGCAGMVGMEGWVREEISRREGGGGGGVKVVDGVKAGVGVLQGLVRGGY
ncbi:hypothetical protein Q9189_005474 [Teloschistes chrysophthalmus]